MNTNDENENKNLPAQTTGGALAAVDFGSDAGAGMENVDASEIRVPFLYVLKTNSPQCRPVENGGTPGAKPGSMMNMGTGELYDGGKAGVCFIPVYRDHNYVEFTPRNLGGGFVAVYPPDDPKVLELRAQQGRFGRLWTGTQRNEKGEPLDGTEITETFYLYGLIVEPSGATSRVIVPFASTQIKKYQAFMQRQMGIKYANPKSTEEKPLPPIQPPIWAHRWHLGTAFEKNKKGEYYGWTLSLFAKKADGSEDAIIKSLVPVSDPLYKEAKAFAESLRSGRASADYNSAGKGENEAGGGEGDDPPM